MMMSDNDRFSVSNSEKLYISIYRTFAEVVVEIID